MVLSCEFPVLQLNDVILLVECIRYQYKQTCCFISITHIQYRFFVLFDAGIFLSQIDGDTQSESECYRLINQ